jgi:hypothetical protein
MWDDGENKLQKVISFLSSEKASRKESDSRKEAAQPAGLFHTNRDEEWGGWSDNEPDTGVTETLEPAKEEVRVTCSTSKKTVQKQKNKKKSKKSKRGGRK